jgi:gliding motility-associated-like protein
MRICKILVAFISLLFVIQVRAAAPNWTVNPSSFQFSMTVTSVANVNCIELVNPTNKIAAFVGSTCRGVSSTSTIINGKYIAYLIVYSNTNSGETVTFKIYNALNDTIYDAKGSVVFQDNASFGVTSSPYTLRNNNAPTAISISNAIISEGLSVNSIVGSLTSIDPDSPETFTYSLVAGAGSTDNASFNLLGSSLRSSAIFDYGVKNTYSIRVRTTDSKACFFERELTITIRDINGPPTGVLLSNTEVTENNNTPTVVGVFSPVDNDSGDTHTYTLVPGFGSTNNGSFSISGNTLRALVSFNFEFKNFYNIRVRVTDAANSFFERTFVITVKDTNDEPTNIQINGSSLGASIKENRPIGSVVGSFTTTDQDVFSTFTYSFVNTTGNNNDQFLIVGSQLRTNNLFDFETRQNYIIYVRTDDEGGSFFTKQFVIGITDSNDAPTNINLSNNVIYENSSQISFISKLSATDPDATGTYSYALVAGAGSSGNASFLIRNDSLYSNAIFDYETTNSYSIRIQLSDGFGGTLQQNKIITILNGNDLPSNINLSQNQIDENSPSNTPIGNLTAIDQDASNTFTYSLIVGAGSTDNNSFNISGNVLRSSASFDFEIKSVYTIRIRVTDNVGAFFDKQFTIIVNNLVDAPTNIVISNDTISENQTSNSLIGLLSSTTQDTITSYTYTFDNSAPGNDNASFIISGKQLRTNAVFNFEAKSTYTIYVRSTLGAVSFVKAIQIFVRNINDAPTDVYFNLTSITENRPSGSFIGMLNTVDPDAGNTFTYSLVTGLGSTHNASFSIRNDSLFSAVSLNFELISTLYIRVQTQDNGLLTFQKAFIINVTDSNDAPTSLSLSNKMVNENMLIGTSIGTLATIDPDINQSFTYSLISGTGGVDNSKFYIAGNQLYTNAVFNFESKRSYAIRIQTNDGNGGILSDSFTVNVVDVNDNPTALALSNNATKENKNVGSLIGLLSTTDEDTLSQFVYSLINSGSNDNNGFFISGNEIRTNTVFNYEAKQIHIIQVQTSDTKGGIFSQQFSISIIDSNDIPSDIILSNNVVSENLTTSSFIGLLNTVDPDAPGGFVYSLVNGVGSNDNLNFRVSNDSLYGSVIFNYETKKLFNIRMRTTDAGNLFFEKTFVININDINDVPTDIQLSSNEIRENLPSRTVVCNLTTIDEDLANTYSYSLVSGAGSTNNNSFVIQGSQLRTNGIFNYETASTYSIRLSTSDLNGGVYEKVFTINVLDSNDAPTNIILSNNIVTENLSSGAKVATLSSIDQDPADQFVYNFDDVISGDNNNFFILGNELRTAITFNYENKSLYVIYLKTTDQSGAAYSKQFIITIKDTNDAPTLLSLNNNTVFENRPIGTFVGKLSTTDPDQASNFAYTLTSGEGSTNNALFYIAQDSLYSNQIFNYENKRTYSVRVRSNDQINSFIESAYTISILDASDAPTELKISNVKLQENDSIQKSIGAFTTADEDANEGHSYTFVAGTGDQDNGSFIIDGKTLFSNFIADFETKTSYSVRVRVEDKDGETFENTFVINVIDTKEKPNIDDQTFTIKENDPAGTSIGVISSSSPDASSVLKYSIITSTDFFVIDENTGLLTNTVAFDYEKTSRYKIKVLVRDNQSVVNVLSDTAEITINIADEIELNKPLPVNNFMSPDGDGVNDFFEIENVSLYADYSLKIFNDIGIELYSTKANYQNDWNGMVGGNRITNGVYYYLFYNTNTGKEFKGTLNVFVK